MAKKKIDGQDYVKINVKKLGFAIGITWGLAVLLTGLGSWLLNYGVSWVDLLNDVYLGFDGSLWGSIIGGIYGFIDGFIGGIVIAWIYNKISS